MINFHLSVIRLLLFQYTDVRKLNYNKFFMILLIFKNIKLFKIFKIFKIKIFLFYYDLNKFQNLLISNIYLIA